MLQAAWYLMCLFNVHFHANEWKYEWCIAVKTEWHSETGIQGTAQLEKIASLTGFVALRETAGRLWRLVQGMISTLILLE